MKFLLGFVYALIAIGVCGSAPPLDLQYMVKLEVTKAGRCSVCSGSFINTNWILTAAHCVHGMDSVIAYIGPPFEGNCSTGYEINKNSIVIHELFREAEQSTYHYDIALIKFTRKTSCRPIEPVQFLNAKPRTQFYGNEPVAFVQFSSSCGQSPALLSVQPVTGDFQCPLDLNMTDRPIVREVLCVPALDYDGSCDGDTSTHLIMRNTDAELIGIMTSPRENDCGTFEAITSQIIFTDVYQFKSWIKNKTKTVEFSSKRSMVRLDISKNGKRYGCTGSFVNPNWILTAAHCVQNANSVVVDIGRHFESSCPMRYAINENEIIIHPSFRMEYNWLGYFTKRLHDIALIKFLNETPCNQHWIARLPAENVQRESYNNLSLPFSRFLNCFGCLLPRDFSYYTESFSVVDNDSCKHNSEVEVWTFMTVKGVITEERRPLEEDQMCVFTGATKRFCKDESGGLLFNGETAELIGIMSRQPNQVCRYIDEVTFTRVSYYVRWIKSHFTKIE